MSDKLHVLQIDHLLKWILDEEKKGKIFGYYKELFFNPSEKDLFKVKKYDKVLDTPIGVAAGPQTQLSQNIILSWLFGARFIELKTVQVLDDIEVKKPCIDMADEGYNCEWSQELSIEDSFHQYLDAWIIIHILSHELKIDNGTIFNISVGYNLEGIKSSKVDWFLASMMNAEKYINDKIDSLRKFYPAIDEIEIPNQISNNVTLSTMHGCPVDEIESIAEYLMEEKKLHTSVKLNPTLLGREELKELLNEELGYKTSVPDEAFEHDIKFDQAVNLIKNLTLVAAKNTVSFGIKLSNTLETKKSNSSSLNSDEMVYMSGRALHPITICTAYKLQKEFKGKLDISFSGGADAFNVSAILECNLKPVTVCSDLLKPGGYSRIKQYLEQISESIKESNSCSLDEFITKGNSTDLSLSALMNLEQYSKEVISIERYKKSFVKPYSVKTNRELNKLDCIYPPCVETCAISQDVPNYLYELANQNFIEASNIILEGNPLPNITGMVCDHLCQSKCTRMNLDNSILIRELKRFAINKIEPETNISTKNQSKSKVAVIGAGPSGLSAAYFLALKNISVDVYESHKSAGGMASSAIPEFRLDQNSITKDVEYIKSLGTQFFFNQKINKESFEKLADEYDYIYAAVGAQKAKNLNIIGEDEEGVFTQLEFLASVKNGNCKLKGSRTAIIGGGNSAVDAARTAKRLSSKVSIVYRRTIEEMPADKEEIRELGNEDIEILELTIPIRIEKADDGLNLICNKSKLGEEDTSGRRSPVIIEGSEFSLTFDNIIIAVGQEVRFDFLPSHKLEVNQNTKETNLDNVYAGGDAIRGADSLVNAVSDGKIAAFNILKKINYAEDLRRNSNRKISLREHQFKLSERIYGSELKTLSKDKRDNFKIVNYQLDEETAIKEASRCLYCDEICNICVSVCPNLANYYYEVKPQKIKYDNLIFEDNQYSVLNSDEFVVEQKYQIININDFCNECGNCDSFCPTSSAPYKIKPKFSLSKKSFANEIDGYLLEENYLTKKENGKLSSFKVNKNNYSYEDEDIILELNSELKPVSLSQKNDKKIKFDMRKVIEMWFYYENISTKSLFKTNIH